MLVPLIREEVAPCSVLGISARVPERQAHGITLKRIPGTCGAVLVYVGTAFWETSQDSAVGNR